MRVICVTFVAAIICATGTVFAAPDDEPAAANAVSQNVSIQLMDYGEGADRKIKLTLSDKWSNLPESTKKHVLEKLRAALSEKSLKQALLALAQGKTEIEISAAPQGKGQEAVPMKKLVPAKKMGSAAVVRLGTPGERVVVKSVKLGTGAKVGLGGEARMQVVGPGTTMKLMEVREGKLKLMAVKEGEKGKVHTFSVSPMKADVRVMVTGAGDGQWQQLSPEIRKQVLESLRSSLPQDQLAEVLKSLSQTGGRGHMARIHPMRGMPGCDCRGANRGHGPRSMFGGRGFSGRDGPHARGGRHGRRGPGARAHSGGTQDALVRALVALTHEVRALRAEVSALRSTHGKPHGKAVPQRRVMMKGTAPKGGAGVGIRVERPKTPTAPAYPVRIVQGKDGKLVLGGMAMPKPDIEERKPAHHDDMRKLRAEMAEIRASLKKLMKDLEKLKTR